MIDSLGACARVDGITAGISQMSMVIPYDFMKNSGARVQRACGTTVLG